MNQRFSTTISVIGVTRHEDEREIDIVHSTEGRYWYLPGKSNYSDVISALRGAGFREGPGILNSLDGAIGQGDR